MQTQPNFKNFLKIALISSVITVTATVLFIIASQYGMITKDSSGIGVYILKKIIELFNDLWLTLIESVAAVYILFFSFFGKINSVYQASKWIFIKCILFSSIFPLFYSIAMFYVSYLPYSSYAIVNTVLGYLLALFIALFLPEKTEK